MHTQPVNKAPLYSSSKDYLHEYLLVVYPGEEMNHKVWDAAAGNQNRLLGDGLAVATRPFIAIADFLAKEEMEETLIRWMQRICCRLHSFRVMLQDYGGFPPHTIYVNIQNPQPLLAIAQQLKVLDEYICSSDCPPVRLVTRPFLMVASQLSPGDYRTALNIYGLKTFHEAFMVNELVLLKRSHHFDACRRVNVFQLLPAEG